MAIGPRRRDFSIPSCTGYDRGATIGPNEARRARQPDLPGGPAGAGSSRGDHIVQTESGPGGAATVYAGLRPPPAALHGVTNESGNGSHALRAGAHRPIG